jgi:hypothetical protein
MLIVHPWYAKHRIKSLLFKEEKPSSGFENYELNREKNNYCIKDHSLR